MSFLDTLTSSWAAIQSRIQHVESNLRVWQLARQVSLHAPRPENPQPVIFFNASTRIAGMSQNAAFSLLAANALQLAGVPVVHFACKAGMTRCVLGSAYPEKSGGMPCRACVGQSRWLYANAPTVAFGFHPSPKIAAALDGLSVHEIADCRWPIADLGLSQSEIPLGALVLSSARWVLRRHHLQDDEATRALLREFVLSAANVWAEFDTLLERVNPRAVILFNGQLFPEAVARWAAQRRGIPAITHEVGIRPLTVFFTPGEATAYPLDIPETFELSEAQNARLDAYLSQRFQGQFTMAGVRFWPEMKGLDAAFLQRAAGFRQIVPVFTNVIFDTSQPHSNVVFPHMFAWLDTVLELARRHTDTLFVIRAHPDETRPGKASRESVADWVAQTGAERLPNVLFVPSQQPLSSYELIQRSKFVMIYNSTIGLEASILGAAVLCAGRARFTQLPTVFFPQTVAAFEQQAAEFLRAEAVSAPPEFARNARRFLYYQLYKSSLPFGDFLESADVAGFVKLRRAISWRQLLPENSPALKVIADGLLRDQNFLLDE